MTQIFVITIQSVVDLITNSSSELFIIGDTTVEIVKEVLMKLVEVQKLATGDERDVEELYQQYFEEPVLVEEGINETKLIAKFIAEHGEKPEYLSSRETPYGMTQVEANKPHFEWEREFRRFVRTKMQNSSFHFPLGYGINIESGSVVVWSAGDNSIPWGIVEAIEHMLSSDRYHIG